MTTTQKRAGGAGILEHAQLSLFGAVVGNGPESGKRSEAHARTSQGNEGAGGGCMALSQVLTSPIGLGRHEARAHQPSSAPSIPTPCAREACKGTLLRDSDGDMTCHQCGRSAVTISPADAYAMRIEVERGGRRRREPTVSGVYGR